MAKFAVLSGNIVSNIIIADSIEVAEQLTGSICIMSDTPSVGWSYNAQTEEFTAPAIEPIIEPIVEEPLPLAE